MPIRDFTVNTGLEVSGSTRISGSVSASGGFTGSLFGTSSYGQDTNLLDGLDSSAFALTASTNYFQASQIVSGNLNVTASLTASSLTASDLNIDYIDFVPQPSATPPAQQIGRIFVDNLYNEVNTWTDVTGVKLLQGQQLVLRAKCTDMATFTRGTVVRINGGTGSNATFVTASWENDTNSADTLGFLMNSGVTNDFAYIIINGYLSDINTDGYTPGQTLYLSSSGNYTNVAPPYPYHEVRLGQVVRAHANVGSIFVRVQNGYELGELHDVYTGSLSPGDLLVYENSVTTQWTNKKQLTGSYGLTGSLTASVGLSGALGLFPTLTGSSISGTTAQYTTISGSNISGALIGTLNGVSAILAGTNLTASTVATVRTINLTSSITSGLSLLTSTTGNFIVLSGTITTGSTALFPTITGSSISGTNLSYTTLNTTQMTSSGKILVDSNVTIGNGKNRTATDIGIGIGALNSTDVNTNYNTAVGAYALTNNTSGTQNTAVGFQSLISNVGGGQNVALGVNALYNNTSGGPNIAIGVGAGLSNTTQTSNIFIGTAAGYNSQANYNVSIGDYAGRYLVSNQNVSIGFYALNSHKGINGNNFALGALSLQTLISGGENIGIGVNTMQGVVNGDGNLTIGSRAISPSLTYGPAGSTVTASYNTAIGYNSLGLMLSGTENLSIGYQSTLYLNTGSQNSAIGTNVLSSLRTGSANTVIGSRALSALQTGSANIVIGNLAGSSIITGSGNIIIGSAAGTNNVNNNIYIADGVGNLRLQINDTGTLDIKSGQIKFPSAQTASTDPNTLDDYEEGNWIPQLSASTTSAGWAYNTSNTSGSYTKIGRRVIINGRLQLTSTGSSAGTVYLSNLPFSIDSGATNWSSLNIGHYQNFSATQPPAGRASPATSVVVMTKQTAGSSTDLSVTDLTNTTDFMFSLVYNHTQ